MRISYDELYPNIKLVDMFPLSYQDQIVLIEAFHECYFDTAVPVETFAPEFQRVVSSILSHYIPIELEHLIEFQPIILDRLDDERKYQLYQEAIRGII